MQLQDQLVSQLIEKAIKGPNSGSGVEYELPTATNARLGGVIIGSGISIDEQGIISTKQRIKSTVVLLATNWNNNQYDLTEDYPNNEYDIEVAVSAPISENALNAWIKAKPVGSNNSNVIVALGTSPPVDIPITITAYEK